jgi:hypothetical protein
MFTGDFEKNALENDFGVASLVKRFTMSVLIMNKHYRLNSTEMVYTPGIIRFAQAMFLTDAPAAVRILREGYGLPNAIAEALASGYLSYEVDGEAVVFSTEEVAL